LKVNDENSRIRIRIRIHKLEVWIRGSRSGSGSTPKCHGSATLAENFKDVEIMSRKLILFFFASLIESGICSLGEMLQLLLRTFMWVGSASPKLDNAALLQLFLETYFTELLSSPNRSLQVDVTSCGWAAPALNWTMPHCCSSSWRHTSQSFSPHPTDHSRL
jgi:hypothetical protein